MKRATFYVRVSTDEQHASGLGLEAQAAACRAAADRLGFEVLSVHEDAMSGATPLERRPALQEAIAPLKAGDALVVAKRDRIGRDPFVVGMIELAVQRAGARIISASGEGTEDDSPSAILMRRIIDAFAEHERLIIKARTRAALQAKRDRNERRGGVPYGLRVDPAHPARSRKSGLPCGLEADAGELLALGSIRRWKGEGLSLRAIARRLDEAGFETKSGRPWSHATVQTLLGRMRDGEA